MSSTGTMTKTALYTEAIERGVGFVANLIANQHRSPKRMLRGLINLLRAGHSVRTAQFSVDELVVDGHAANWCVLNEWAARTK